MLYNFNTLVTVQSDWLISYTNVTISFGSILRTTFRFAVNSISSNPHRGPRKVIWWWTIFWYIYSWGLEPEFSYHNIVHFQIFFRGTLFGLDNLMSRYLIQIKNLFMRRNLWVLNWKSYTLLNHGWLDCHILNYECMKWLFVIG